MLAGASVSHELAERFAVFALASAGRIRERSHTYETSPAPIDPFASDISVTIPAPAAQLGGGLDIGLSRRLSIRTTLEYRRVFARRILTLRFPSRNDVTMTTGPTVALGSRSCAAWAISSRAVRRAPPRNTFSRSKTASLCV